MATIARTGGELRSAVDRLKAKVLALPTLAQAQITRECAYSWQWARATWAQTEDYWTGRYRGSVNIGIGRPDTSSLPPHPESPSWPEHPSSPYLPADLDAPIARIMRAAPAVTYVSVTLDYAAKVEAHAHPRTVAYESAVTYPYNWSAIFASVPT